MTIIFPAPSAGDKILALLGKRRAAFIPDIYGRFGKYAVTVFPAHIASDCLLLYGKAAVENIGNAL